MGKQKQGAAGASAALEGENGFALISNETLTRLYANLLKCRQLNDFAQAQAGRNAGRNGMNAGGEAAAVGVTMDMVPGDTVKTTGNGMVEGFLTGMPLARAIGAQRADAEAGQNFAGAMHHALGAALSHKATKSGKVAVVFWRKEVSVFWSEALEIARTHGLPMIFVRHGESENGRAVRTNPAKDVEIPGGPDDLGLPSIAVDGNDVVAVYRVAHESIGRARRGRGPTLIECGAFRLNGKRKSADSIVTMENYLRGKGLFKREMKAQVVEEFLREMDAAKKAARKAARV